ncbi:MMPL family transporter [Streptomyces boncukensis]|uniref:MMPL family transporter n=1 Tax=Streptomyces boncukensis TaxID=2711219 RepID=A0A6G4WQR0_9ACTN|nr:MMPL family transporter [Streptomyces boncukensis]NGO67609.1 MMPL family transporter [Streptomyces boncukensis]
MRARGARRGIAGRIGAWSAQHRWKAVAAWLLFAVAAMVLGGIVGQVDAEDHDTVPGEAGEVVTTLREAGVQDPARESVLVRSEGPVTGRAARDAVDDVMASVKRTGRVTGLRSPYETEALSEDGHAALIQFAVTGDPATAGDRVGPVLTAVDDAAKRHPDLTVEQFGAASADKAIGDAFSDDFKQAEYSVVPLAIGILFIAFGALVAAVLPVVLALTAVLATTGLVALASHAVPMSDSSGIVMLLVGMAVGVDYCLFYLRREREERAQGRDAGTALRIASATSGRAILVSGSTVIVAMAGMFFTGMVEFEGMGLATLLVVAVAMTGSVTVLPALLSLLGDRVEKGRLPFRKPVRQSADGESRVWRAVLGTVLRRPAVCLAAGAGVLIALAVPATALHPAELTLKQELGDIPLVRAYEDISKTFPGGPEPAEVVVSAADITDPGVRGAIADFRREAVGSGASQGPVQVTEHRGQNLAVIEVPLAGGEKADRNEQSLRTLRDQVRPRTLGGVDGVKAPIGGPTAASKDFADQLGSSVAPVFAFVIAFAFVLMLLFFRSPLIALTSTVLNLLSIGAAYGILTAVFQKGWGASLIGAEGVGAIESWLPLFLFVILFGLSMDYHVFVVSRIREARLRGMSTRDAISHGIATTAGVVTSAAVIMVGVFAIFGTLSLQGMKQMGLGLAMAVLIDATLIRGMLLPAAMALLGEANWYVPALLRKLPELEGEPEPPGGRPAGAPRQGEEAAERAGA